MKTQNQEILDWMLKGYPITPLDALKMFGCFRLSARIFQLREKYPINMKRVTRNGTSYASYSIQEDYNPL